MIPPLRRASAASRATPTTSASMEGAVPGTTTVRQVVLQDGGSVGGRRGDVCNGVGMTGALMWRGRSGSAGLMVKGAGRCEDVVKEEG